MNANEGLVKTYTASGAIGEYKLVKFGATDKTVLQASTGTDKLAGVVCLPKGTTAVTSDSVDVIKSGIADVIGGTVTRGDYLTSNASGFAVVAVAGDNVIGTAELSGVSGDLGAVHIQKSSI